MHILQGDLILHKRTLEPIKTVVYGLRRYDDDRVAAMSERVDPTVKIQGYMSHKAKIYLVCALMPYVGLGPCYQVIPSAVEAFRVAGYCPPFVVRFGCRARPARRVVPSKDID